MSLRLGLNHPGLRQMLTPVRISLSGKERRHRGEGHVKAKAEESDMATSQRLPGASRKCKTQENLPPLTLLRGYSPANTDFRLLSSELQEN